MKTKCPFISIVAYTLASFGLMWSEANAEIWFVPSPSTTQAAPGGAFVSTITISSASRSLGAFSVLVKYTGTIIGVQQVALPEGSGFSGNLFADSSSFASGVTRVVGFQTTDKTSHPSGQAVFQILWKASGTSGQQHTSTITVEPETVNDSSWLDMPVQVTSAQVDVSGIDSNNDGIPDWWVAAKSLSQSDPDVAKGDADGDGATNFQEYLAGTDPNSGTSVLRAACTPPSPGRVDLTWVSEPGHHYQIQATTDLAAPFTPLGGIIAGAIGKTTMTFSEETAASRKFYRVAYLTAPPPAEYPSPIHLVRTEGRREQVTWSSVPGYRYQVYTTTDLTQPFVPVGDVIMAGLGEASLTYTCDIPREPRRFFKVVVVP